MSVLHLVSADNPLYYGYFYMEYYNDEHCMGDNTFTKGMLAGNRVKAPPCLKTSTGSVKYNCGRDSKFFSSLLFIQYLSH